MKQLYKKELKHVFEAPRPQCKKAFLRTLAQPKMSVSAFVLSQLGYIRRWVWMVSALFFVLSVVAWAQRLPAGTVWVISAMMPLLALTVVCESGRSENYETAELEMATRFSLRSVVLARMGILGMENLVLLGLLSLGLRQQSGSAQQAAGVPAWGIVILLPYLLTTYAGLAVVRRIRGREAVYICAGIAACISISVMALHGCTFPYCLRGSVMWWPAAALLLLTATARQCAFIVKRTEAA